MTIALGTNTGLYVKTGAIATDPAPQHNQRCTLSNTVDAVACTLNLDGPRSCGFWRFTVNGVNWINQPLSHGQGLQWADNKLRTGEVVARNANAPTEQGRQADGSSAVTGTSNCLYRAISADNKRIIRVQHGAHWGAPYQVTNVVPAWNKRLVCRDKVVTDTIWGWNGDDHVIQFLRDVHVTDPIETPLAQEWDAVTCSIYAEQTVFGTEEYLNPATGATSVYPGFPDTSSSLITMVSSADQTKAMCTYQPLGEWGATGYSQLWTSVGLQNMFIRAREVYAGGSVPLGTRRYNAYLVFGSRAQVITSVQALHAADITRSTDIALPDVT